MADCPHVRCRRTADTADRVCKWRRLLRAGKFVPLFASVHAAKIELNH